MWHHKETFMKLFIQMLVRPLGIQVRSTYFWLLWGHVIYCTLTPFYIQLTDED